MRFFSRHTTNTVMEVNDKYFMLKLWCLIIKGSWTLIPLLHKANCVSEHINKGKNVSYISIFYNNKDTNI